MRIIQQPTRLFALLLVVLLANTVSAYMPQEEGFTAPSLEVKAAMVADYEDVIVMQAEMAWGEQEMRKYKSLRGEFPVRSDWEGRKGSSTASTSKSELPPEFGLRRRNEGSPNHKDGKTKGEDYWTYLISIF